jgi:Zn-dependent protease with chaperone function
MELLLECSIRAALIATAVAAVVGGLRIGAATARHLAWCGVLAAMLMLPAFSVWGPKATVRVLPAATEALGIEPSIPPASQDAGPPGPPVPKPRSSLVQQHLRPGPNFLFVGYLIGTGVLIIRLLFGTARAASLLRRAFPEQGFVTSPECACPVTVGWRRPTIVLPSSWCDWPRAELDAVLAHEREHAHRRDPLIQWFAALNRCIFWFHPLAWWLERKLAMLAEEVCDAAAVARGHDRHDYIQYLLNQAHAIRRAGARVALHGASIGQNSLSKRIRLLLESRPIPELSRRRALLGIMLCTSVIIVFTACQLAPAEKLLPGQPTMNELMHRRTDSYRLQEEKHNALMERARGLSPDEVQSLLAKLKDNPEDANTFWTLVRHYEYRGNTKGLDALRLWYIEHQPGGQIYPGNISPQLDRAGYERGKALWLAHLKRPGTTREEYQRAVDFLEGGDRPLAESALRAGQRAYSDDTRWASDFGRHYAQALLGSGEPLTEFNVFRVVNTRETQSLYAQSVRARLAESSDVPLLAQTAQYLLAWGTHCGKNAGLDAMQLARTCVDRALSIEPTSGIANVMKLRVTEFEQRRRVEQLVKMSPAELATISDSDRILRTLSVMRSTWMNNPDDAATKARELLDLAARNRNDILYGDAVFEANMILGKYALRRGDRKVAARDLLAAAATPGSERIKRGEFEMNLPRALADWGERRAVAEFFERVAPKTVRAKQFQDWATQILKGVNPDLIPTFSFPGCSHDPC